MSTMRYAELTNAYCLIYIFTLPKVQRGNRNPSLEKQTGKCLEGTTPLSICHSQRGGTPFRRKWCSCQGWGPSSALGHQHHAWADAVS